MFEGLSGHTLAMTEVLDTRLLNPIKPLPVAYSRLAMEFEEIRPLFRISALDILADAYDEPGRYYHNAEHMLMLLRLFRRFRDLATDPVAVKAAIFFHDAIYHIPLDPQYPPARDNEERSIKLMTMQALNPHHPSLLKAAQIIRATIGHSPGWDIDTRLMHDMDLSILASSRQRYARYEREVRGEYEVYPLALYTPARLGQLRAFIERRRIFTVPGLSALWEVRARSNISWAIDQLAQGKVPA